MPIIQGRFIEVEQIEDGDRGARSAGQLSQSSRAAWVRHSTLTNMGRARIRRASLTTAR
ncbi:MAG: hypothetical protein AB1801_15720 [Chloroflexota bacterium]